MFPDQTVSDVPEPYHWLPAPNRARVKQKNKVGMGAAPPIFASDTHPHRALNRRVEVLIAPVDCGMTL